jgi:hypothetical protein
MFDLLVKQFVKVLKIQRTERSVLLKGVTKKSAKNTSYLKFKFF